MIYRYNVHIIDSDERGNYFGVVDSQTGDVIAHDSWMPQLSDLSVRLNSEETENFNIYTKNILEYCICNGNVSTSNSVDFHKYIQLSNKFHIP